MQAPVSSPNSQSFPSRRRCSGLVSFSFDRITFHTKRSQSSMKENWKNTRTNPKSHQWQTMRNELFLCTMCTQHDFERVEISFSAQCWVCERGSGRNDGACEGKYIKKNNRHIFNCRRCTIREAAIHIIPLSVSYRRCDSNNIPFKSHEIRTHKHIAHAEQGYSIMC